MVSQPIAHSKAAASRDRIEVYAAHNEFGKAQIWLTFSPDDTQSIQIAWYAMGEDFEERLRSNAPDGSFRFELTAKNPGAAALHFEHVLELVISDVIGWDVKRRRPFKRGGYFGVPKAWLRVIEEQGRLTVHAHFLIWIYGHRDIKGKFQRASSTVPKRVENEQVILTLPKEVRIFFYLDQNYWFYSSYS